MSADPLPEPSLVAAPAIAAGRGPEARGPVVVILNPASNNGRAGRLRRLVEQALREGRGDLVLTTARGDAGRLAAEAASAGRPVVVVGGDGAMHEAVNGVMASGRAVPVGIVPAGSGNDYALRVARAPLDPARALEVALNAPTEWMDVGACNGVYFTNALSVGLDANVTARAERYKRLRLSGEALYMTSALTELLLHYDACPRLNVALDDAAPLRQLCALVAISIGPTYGGGFKINPTADPQDGLFDVCILSKPSLPRALRLLPAVERGAHAGQPETRMARASRVVIECEGPVNAQLDGELARVTRLDARIVPGALALRRGPARAAR